MTKAVNLFAKYAKDTKKELTDGAKFIIDAENDSYIMVRRAFNRNKEFAKANAEVTKRFGERESDAAEQASNEVFIRQLIVGWHNIADEKGKKVEFTTEKAVELLLPLPDLLNELMLFSLDGDNYKVDEIAKN